MDNTPLFSIIIPTLNEEEALPHLLSDLDQQTFFDFEVTIVDAYSEDKTPQIALHQCQNPKFHLVQTKERNVSTQRNLGAKQSRGTWLIFFDADSRIKPTFLAQLASGLKKYPCDACNLFAQPDKKDKSSVLFVAAQNIALYTLTAVGVPYAVGACFAVKRHVFERVGGFNPQIHHMEDSELARRIKEARYSVRMLVSPRYVYSLRRQRKEGTLKIIATNYPYYLKSLIANEFVTPKELYPMKGGKAHEKKELNDF